jgi:hypothetical protein
VELFQSQGCSSCPPASANFAAVADRPDVIALNFAVTYWNQLGWTDTFAQSKFNARQWDYAHAFHSSSVYTPQVVVDGRRQGVGADKGEFARLLAAPAEQDGPSLTLSNGVVAIGSGPKQARAADIWLVRFDPRTLQVLVRRGENRGKTLAHRNIVRELARLGAWSGRPLTLRLPPATARLLDTAILIQRPNGGPILAAVRD